jgi:MarR family transcriptional regulator, temperature-dependent positive regulator of motility
MNKVTRTDRSPAHLLHRVGQSAHDILFDELITVSGLTPRQLAVLMTVSADEGLSQTILVERTGMDRSTTGDVVLRFKKKGLLERRRTKKDARAYAVTLTDEGRRVLQTVQPLAKKVDDLILGALPGEQGAHFLSSLRSIIATLQRPA